MPTTFFIKLKIAAAATFVVLATTVFAQDEQSFYLIGDYNGWVHMGDDPKFSMGDDGLWHKTLNLRTDQGVKVVNIEQTLYSATLSTPHNSVTDEMIKSQTPIPLEAKGSADDDDDLIAQPIIYLQTEGTREFVLESETMTLTVIGTPHSLSLTPVTQGTAHLSTYSARWGEDVTITFEPMDGYSLSNIEVKAEDGSLITVIDEVFEMPDQPVSVTVTFEETRYGKCGDNLYWQVNNDYSTLTIQGSGPMYDYQMYTQPWLNFKDRITELYINDGIETLGSFAFCGMNNLTNSVSIPNGVVSIGESCFEYAGISSVNLPSSIQSLGKNAFNNARITAINLEDCTAPELTTLPEGVLQHTDINTITIPANITAFEDNAIASNDALSDVTLLSANISQLGNNAFGDITATLRVDNVDVYHAIHKVGAKWGGANCFTILPLDEKSFHYAFIEDISGGYIYTGQPIELTPQLILCDEVLSPDNYDLKYYKDEEEVDAVVDLGTYRCEFTPAAGTDYKDEISKTFIVSNEFYNFIDENGEEQTLPKGNYTELTEDMLTLKNGWYVINSNITITERIEVVEDGAKILLCDGYTLTAERGIHCSNKEFGIYGQSENNGKLIAVGYDSGAAIGGNIHENGPILTINGGNILATSDNSSAAIGGGDQGRWSGTYGSNIKITINGGVVTALSRGYGAGIGGGGCEESVYNLKGGDGGIITLNGGQVDASSDFGYGIGPGRIKDFADNDGESGNISFGWNKPSDLITMTSVSGALVFNKIFAIDGEYIKATQDNVNKKFYIKLVPANAIDIAEGIENGSVEIDQNACPIGEAKQFKVYVYPDQDYELNEIKVYINNDNSTQHNNSLIAPRDNNEVPITKDGEHEYSFEMPNASVIITASFKEITPTGVIDIDTVAPSSNKRYNLMGQPVDENYKGIIIIDGKKLIIK